jgi:hypothetical protein
MNPGAASAASAALATGADIHYVWSPHWRAVERDAVSSTSARLIECSLIRGQGASIHVGKAWLSHTDVREDGGGHPIGLPVHLAATLDRAHEALRPWRRPNRDRGLRIVDVDLDQMRARARPAVPTRRRRTSDDDLGRLHVGHRLGGRVTAYDGRPR